MLDVDAVCGDDGEGVTFHRELNRAHAHACHRLIGSSSFFKKYCVFLNLIKLIFFFKNTLYCNRLARLTCIDQPEPVSLPLLNTAAKIQHLNITGCRTILACYKAYGPFMGAVRPKRIFRRTDKEKEKVNKA